MARRPPTTPKSWWIRVNWRVIERWQHVTMPPITDAELSRRMGVSKSHFCEIRHERKAPSADFLKLLKVATGIPWAVLLLETDHVVSVREQLGMDHLEDGRPWPVQWSAEHDRRVKRWNGLARLREENAVQHAMVNHPEPTP